MTDVLPAGMTAVSFAGTTTGWGTCTLTPAIFCSSNGAFTPIPAGATGTQTLTLVATINAGVAPGTILTNTATVGGGGEINITNDTATDPLTVAGLPVLSIVKTASNGGVFTQGGTAFFTMTVSNQAGSPPTFGTVTLTDTFPPGVTPTSASGTGMGRPARSVARR